MIKRHLLSTFLTIGLVLSIPFSAISSFIEPAATSIDYSLNHLKLSDYIHLTPRDLAKNYDIKMTFWSRFSFNVMKVHMKRTIKKESRNTCV